MTVYLGKHLFGQDVIRNPQGHSLGIYKTVQRENNIMTYSNDPPILQLEGKGKEFRARVT